MAPELHPSGQSSSYFGGDAVGQAMGLLDPITSVGFEAIIEFDGELDEGRMVRAWSSVRDRHPLLRCERRDGAWQPTAGPGPAEMRMMHDGGHHTLRLSCDHVAFDGLGSLILLGDLRSAYVSRAAPGTDWSARRFEDSTASVRAGLAMATAARALSRWRLAPTSTHRDPAPEVPSEPSSGHHVMELGQVVGALVEERRRWGWSTDALLVGILEQAWTAVLGPPSRDSVWMVAQDFRPDLGLTRGLGNLSLIDTVVTAGSVMESAETVTAQLRSQREDLLRGAVLGTRFGASGPPVMRALMHRGRRLRYFRSLSNVGQLDDRLDDWGTARASRVYFVGPMAHPPYSSFIAAGRGESVLVTVRTSPDWLTPEHARDLETAAIDAAAVL